MPRMVDITGPIYEGMWTYGEPYAPFRMEQVPPVDWVAYPTYTQNVSMNVQTGTYLETGAHMYPEMRTVDALTPDDLILSARIVFLKAKEARSRIQVGEVREACEGIPPGAAVLICTGWGRNWDDRGFLRDSPHFSAEAMEAILALNPALVGADLPRWDSPDDPQGFFGRFFRQDVLLLAPVVNLERFGQTSGRLMVFPLPIRGACASPARAVLLDARC